jgi:hypothetical protein
MTQVSLIGTSLSQAQHQPGIGFEIVKFDRVYVRVERCFHMEGISSNLSRAETSMQIVVNGGGSVLFVCDPRL